MHGCGCVCLCLPVQFPGDATVLLPGDCLLHATPQGPKLRLLLLHLHMQDPPLLLHQHQPLGQTGHWRVEQTHTLFTSSSYFIYISVMINIYILFISSIVWKYTAKQAYTLYMKQCSNAHFNIHVHVLILCCKLVICRYDA